MTAARLGRRALVLAGDIPGGQLLSIEKVDGFPGYPEGIAGHDLCPLLQEQATGAGAEFLMSGAERICAQDGQWQVTTTEGDVLSRAMIVATGSSLKKLGVSGEERLTGSGVSQCASCDGTLFPGRTVAVIGGGDSAMQEALTLAEFAGRVIILHRGGALTGQAYYRDRVIAREKIDVRFNTIVEEILGDARVSGLRVQDIRTGARFELETAAVFAYVGLQPNAGFLHGLIEFDPTGRIPTDADMRTELIGVCAAGTVRSQSACRAASAAGDGVSAAVAVDRYLTDGSWRAG